MENKKVNKAIGKLEEIVKGHHQLNARKPRVEDAKTLARAKAKHKIESMFGKWVNIQPRGKKFVIDHKKLNVYLKKNNIDLKSPPSV